MPILACIACTTKFNPICCPYWATCTHRREVVPPEPVEPIDSNSISWDEFDETDDTVFDEPDFPED